VIIFDLLLIINRFIFILLYGGDRPGVLKRDSAGHACANPRGAEGRIAAYSAMKKYATGLTENERLSPLMSALPPESGHKPTQAGMSANSQKRTLAKINVLRHCFRKFCSGSTNCDQDNQRDTERQHLGLSFLFLCYSSNGNDSRVILTETQCP